MQLYQSKNRTAWSEQPTKAIVCTRYGPPDVFQLKDVDQPTPRDTVHSFTAASLHVGPYWPRQAYCFKNSSRKPSSGGASVETTIKYSPVPVPS